MAYESVNPYDGKTVKKFEELSNDQLEAKIKAATDCFQVWKKKSYAERAVIIAKAGELMRTHVDQFAKHATTEMGKLINEARGEVKFSADILTYYAKTVRNFSHPLNSIRLMVKPTWKAARLA
jgi:succinate-semialdehyde dehydrogenase/glutarate-semialdehyde dehydrogenase